MEKSMVDDFEKNFFKGKKTSLFDGCKISSKQDPVPSGILWAYEKVLEKTRMFAQELSLNSSLDLANFFTYLLWNGYFSYHHIHIYNGENLKYEHNFLPYSIFDSAGVCIHHTEMLKDFLNFNHYPSATVCGYLHHTKLSYTPKIPRYFKKENFLFRLFLLPGQILSGNHALNVIKDQESLYLYDATNLFLATPLPKGINGEINLTLYPNSSLSFLKNKQELEALKKLLQEKQSFCSYDFQEYQNSWEKILLASKTKIDFFETFYQTLKPYQKQILFNTKKEKHSL